MLAVLLYHSGGLEVSCERPERSKHFEGKTAQRVYHSKSYGHLKDDRMLNDMTHGSLKGLKSNMILTPIIVARLQQEVHHLGHLVEQSQVEGPQIEESVAAVPC